LRRKLVNILIDRSNMDPVLRVLTDAFISKKQMQWSLVPLEEWPRYQVNNILNDNSNPTIKSNNSKASSSLGTRFSTVKAYDNRHNKVGQIFDLEKFQKKYRYIQPLLDRYYGKLAVCGGFYSNPEYYYKHSNTDIDIFFHSCSHMEASQILKDCVLYLINTHFENQAQPQGKEPKKDNIIAIGLPVIGKTFNGSKAKQIKAKKRENEKTKRVEIQIERRLYITNVKFITYEDQHHTSWQNICTYQFIHRIYPNLGSILGGFDLGPSMVAYDGRNILATEFGAWTYANKAMIVDISRRSTTFGSRLQKYYSRGFDIILPGILQSTLDSRRNNTKFHQLREFMGENGIEFKCPGGHTFPYDGGYRDTGCDIDFEGHFAKEFIELTDFRIRIKSKEDNVADNIVPLHYSRLNEQAKHFQQKYEKKYGRKIPIPGASDYGDWNMTKLEEISDGNRTAFLHSYPESVTAVLFNADLALIFKDSLLFSEMNLMSLTWDRFLLDPQTPFREIEWSPHDANHKFLERKYAEYSDELVGITYEEQFNGSVRNREILEELNERCRSNMEELTDNLRGIKWITQDPWRQWTSSINPEVVSAEEFYGECHTPVYVGLPSDVETLLRLSMKTEGSVWYKLPRNIFDLIVILSLGE